MNFTWQRFFDHIKPVAIFLAAILGYLGIFPKLIFLGIIVWQILTRGSTLWSAVISFFNTVGGWIKGVFK